MNQYIMVSTTFDSKDEAEKVADILLNKRLVSCCQLGKIESSYHWEGKIEKANEYLLQMKSKKVLYKEIEKAILDNHSYDTPQILSYNISEGYEEYLKWIDNETK